MTLPKSEQKRPYLTHGHCALTKALRIIGNQDGWVESLGEVGESLQAWKGAIIEDLGGESEVSAMELSVIELSCKTHLLLASVDRFLLAQPSLVNKSKRQLFPIVLQRQALADALSAYMRTLGLKKKRKPPASLNDYLKGKTSPPHAGSPNTKDTKHTNEGAKLSQDQSKDTAGNNHTPQEEHDHGQ